MVQNGEAKCRRKSLSEVEVVEKTIIEDEAVCQKVVSFLLYSFKSIVWL